MNESIKSSIQKGIEVYTSGRVSEEEVSNKAFLLVVKAYYKKHGYIPRDWINYMEDQLKQRGNNENN